MYKFLFGPVPSRRLGMSLGVDLVPHKVCSLDCIYCECGATTKLTLDRMEYIPFKKVVAELEHYFANQPDPDYITFSGSGEPTLNSRIGDVLHFIKQAKPNLPVAVLTNGTLLSQKQVRLEIMEADLVLPSLDAATEKTFRKINRPANEISLDNYIQGLVDFSMAFTGNLWLEIFIIPGINDSKEELHALKEACLRIQPDKIQINTLDRPGTEEDIPAASPEQLRDIVAEWNLENMEIIASYRNRTEVKSYRKDTEAAILETIHRRPCTLEDLSSILGLHINEVNKYLDVLEKENKILHKRLERGLFYYPVVR